VQWERLALSVKVLSPENTYVEVADGFIIPAGNNVPDVTGESDASTRDLRPYRA